MISTKIKAAKRILESRLLSKPMPLFVGFSITSKCNYKCSYCDTKKHKQELSTDQILDIIHQLKKQGCLRISFTGGEPLLRDDIGKIINYAKKLGIYTSLTTNGSLIKKRLQDIRDIDVIQVSIDGPEHINDKLRGKGSYKDAINALNQIHDSNIRPVILSVISSANIEYIPELIEIAKNHSAQIRFQPIRNIIKESGKLQPSEEEYSKTIKTILSYKRKNKNLILNSRKALLHILHNNDQKPKTCAASKIYYRIEADGMMYMCLLSDIAFDLNKVSVKQAFQKQAKLISIKNTTNKCSYRNCGSSKIELGLIYNLDFGSIIDKILGRY